MELSKNIEKNDILKTGGTEDGKTGKPECRKICKDCKTYNTATMMKQCFQLANIENP